MIRSTVENSITLSARSHICIDAFHESTLEGASEADKYFAMSYNRVSPTPLRIWPNQTAE